MPFLQIFTTLSRARVPPNLGHLAAVALSRTLRGKPIERICVHVATDQMIFSGSQATPNGPTAYAVLRSVGSLEPDDNRRTAQMITDLLHRELDLPPHEIRLLFDDYPASHAAVNGRLIVDPKP